MQLLREMVWHQEWYCMLNRIVSLKNINKSFSEHEILKNISFDIFSSEMVAVVGKSGAGKTTLMNIVGLLDHNYSGNYYFLGSLIDKKKDLWELRGGKIGFVFQSYYLIPTLSVYENIKMPLEYSFPKKSQDVPSLWFVKNLGINSFSMNPVSSLSGGEKQRVSLCRALIRNPVLLLCDEPTGNLDEENSRIVVDILKNCKKRGISSLIVTHNDFVAHQCDRIFSLTEGNLFKEK